MKTSTAAVMALTLGLLLAAPGYAHADEAPPPPPPAAASATPLATRPSKPLTLAGSNEGTSFGYKLLAVVAIAAGATYWVKRKRAASAPGPKARIDILGRASVGVRNELLVVEVDGTRLLVGMTPGAIQTLAVLDTGSNEVVASEPSTASEAATEPSPIAPLAERARALLGGMRLADEDLAPAPAPARTKAKDKDKDKEREPATVASIAPAPTPAPKRAPRAAKGSAMPRVAGQAKGLLLALEPQEDR